MMLVAIFVLAASRYIVPPFFDASPLSLSLSGTQTKLDAAIHDSLLVFRRIVYILRIQD